MPTPVYLYQANHSFRRPPDPPQKQHHVVVADADTGKRYLVDEHTDNLNDPPEGHIIGQIADKNSMIYFEWKTGRRTVEEIAGEIERHNLNRTQVQNLQRAYRELYREELKVFRRPIPAAHPERPATPEA